MATIDVFVKECSAFQLNFSALIRLYFSQLSPPPHMKHRITTTLLCARFPNLSITPPSSGKWREQMAKGGR